MANPFRSLADMIGDILTYLTAPGNDVNAKLDAINKKLDQISLNLGVQPVLLHRQGVYSCAGQTGPAREQPRLQG